MKRIFPIAAILMAVLLAVPAVTAASEGMMKPTGADEHGMMESSEGATGGKVMEENRIETENHGTDARIESRTGEQPDMMTGEGGTEGSEPGKPAETPRSEIAREHMSIVAQKVEEFLSDRDTESGIGSQVREIATAQNRVQSEVTDLLSKIDTRQGWKLAVFGPDYHSLTALKKQTEQNQLQIQELTQLSAQIKNTGDATKLQEVISAMIAENTALQEHITTQEGRPSLLGWLVRMFAR